MADFILGGPVPPDSPVYRGRHFEHECLGHLAAGRWVLLLGPRQHGKTSALVRLRLELLDQGFRVAFVDAQAYAGGTAEANYSDFLRWLASRVATTMELELPPIDPMVAEDLEGTLALFLEQTAGDLVVLIDEAAAVPSAYRTKLFSQFRALFNARAFADPAGWLNRLNVLFTGTFRPESVISDENSPFNVSQVVYTNDLTAMDASCLLEAAIGTSLLEHWALKAHELVGGQPYLLQVLFEAVVPGADDAERQQLFDAAVANLRNGRDRHVPALLERVLAEPGGVEAARAIAMSADGVAATVAPPYDILPVFGLAVLRSGRVIVASELYRQVVVASPQINPTAVPNTFVPLGHQPPDVFDVIQDGTLREVTRDAYAAAVDAANAGHFRTALVNFGATYEALASDFLKNGLTSNERAAARQGVLQNGQQIANDMSKWSLQSKLAVTHKSGRLPTVNPAISNTIREWRNLIHPQNASQNFQPQSDLGPEVSIAVAATEKFLQALRSFYP